MAFDDAGLRYRPVIQFPTMIRVGKRVQARLQPVSCRTEVPAAAIGFQETNAVRVSPERQFGGMEVAGRAVPGA